MDRTDFMIALYKAFNFGQEYWQYADSENPRQWEQADIIREKFRTFVSETVKKFEDGV